MSDYIEKSQKNLEQILQDIETKSAPYVELSSDALATIVGGAYLQGVETENQAGDGDVDTPDCLIWDIDTAG